MSIQLYTYSYQVQIFSVAILNQQFPGMIFKIYVIFYITVQCNGAIIDTCKRNGQLGVVTGVG